MDSLSLFLSYNGVDRLSVVAVQRLLEEGNHHVPGPVTGLLQGFRGLLPLRKGSGIVGGVAAFIGRDLGGWQKREMWFALDRQVREEKEGRRFPVIPVLLAGADLTTSFLFLNTWIDLRSGLDGGVTAEPLKAFESAIKATSPAAATERVSTVRPYRGLEAFMAPRACEASWNAMRFAVLSDYYSAIDAPSETWLGRSCPCERIRRFGDVELGPPDPQAFPNRLGQPVAYPDLFRTNQCLQGGNG
jgi:hypothetical protein